MKIGIRLEDIARLAQMGLLDDIDSPSPDDEAPLQDESMLPRVFVRTANTERTLREHRGGSPLNPSAYENAAARWSL